MSSQDDEFQAANCALLILCSALDTRLNAKTLFVFKNGILRKREMTEVLISLPKPVALSGRRHGDKVEVSISTLAPAHSDDWNDWAPFLNRPRTSFNQHVLFVAAGRSMRLTDRAVKLLLSEFSFSMLGMSISGNNPSILQSERGAVWVIRVGAQPEVEYFSSEAAALERGKQFGLG